MVRSSGSDTTPKRSLPLVSIGIPTFNRPALLRETLKCATTQTYSELEIIVSDNCSSGNETRRVVEEFASTDPRIRYFRQAKNIGAANNFQFVLNEATGKYFAWFADDDACATTFISTLLDCLESHDDIVLAMSDVRIIGMLASANSEAHLETNRVAQVTDEWPSVRRHFFTYPPTTNIYFSIYGLYRIDVLRKCRLRFSGRWKGLIFANEVPFLARIAAHGKIASVPQTLKSYNSHDGSEFVKEMKQISAFDRLVRESELKTEITLIALHSDISLIEKLLLSLYPWPRLSKARNAIERALQYFQSE